MVENSTQGTWQVWTDVYSLQTVWHWQNKESFHPSQAQGAKEFTWVTYMSMDDIKHLYHEKSLQMDGSLPKGSKTEVSLQLIIPLMCTVGPAKAMRGWSRNTKEAVQGWVEAGLPGERLETLPSLLQESGDGLVLWRSLAGNWLWLEDGTAQHAQIIALHQMPKW